MEGAATPNFVEDGNGTAVRSMTRDEGRTEKCCLFLTECAQFNGSAQTSI